ncbi:MAG: energy transducer TonB [Xanthomonadales bacterium]|nr:energy transducer TonB [Xanthomonadales bacterium]
MRSMLVRLLLLIWMAGAAEASRLPDEFDAYMFVDGEVSVSDIGRVTTHRIDTEVEPQIKALVDRVVSRWLFEPVRIGDAASAFTSSMRVTLHGVAKGDDLIVRVEDVEFRGSAASRQGDSVDRSIRATGNEPPHYPREALLSRIQGSTTIALRIDRDGRVVDAAVSHTDLVGRSRSERTLTRARGLLERSSLNALKQWRFALADNAIPEGKSTTSVLIPVAYSVSDGSDKGWIEAGRWTILTMGQKQRIDWLGDGEVAAALGSNGAGSTLPVRLLTQPDGNAL